MKICTAGFPCWETQKGRLGTPRTRKALVGHQGICWALRPAGLPRSFTAAASNVPSWAWAAPLLPPASDSAPFPGAGRARVLRRRPGRLGSGPSGRGARGATC